jgi:hypothetical protein
MATASAATAKWKRNTASADQSYKDGVMGVRVAPGELAAAAVATMRANLLESIDSGRWADRVRGTSLQSWQGVTSTKGASNYLTGVRSPQAEQKRAAFDQVWQPLMEQAKAAARSIDKSTEAGALERVRLVMNIGKQYKQTRGR